MNLLEISINLSIFEQFCEITVFKMYIKQNDKVY